MSEICTQFEKNSGNNQGKLFLTGGIIMKVLVSKIELRIPQASSLKDKRRVVKGLKDRIWSKFRASISEIDRQNRAQEAVLGLVYVSNDKPLLESIMNKIINLVETSYPGLLHTYEYTVEHYG